MAKYYCLGSTTIPTKKIKQFISDVVVFLLCSFFLLKLLPLFRGPKASIPEDEHECEPGSFKKKKKNPVESSLRESDDFEEAKSSEVVVDKNFASKVEQHHKAMEFRSTSFNRGSHTREQPMTISHTLSDLGSMRAGKEWSTTLACKLFQERSSAIGGGGEGMDKLWEVYESSEEENQRENHRGEEEEEKSKNKKSRIVDYLVEFEEEEEEEGEVGSLCCLKALKLSVGKVNYGMKISKAFKGVKVGWLNPNHHHHHHKKKMKKKKDV